MPRNVGEARDHVGQTFGTVYKKTFNTFGEVSVPMDVYINHFRRSASVSHVASADALDGQRHRGGCHVSDPWRRSGPPPIHR